MSTDEAILGEMYFYIDYRDDKYGRYNYFRPPHVSGRVYADIWIKYDADDEYDHGNESFYWKRSDNTFTKITKGEIIRIWEIMEKEPPETAEFGNKTSSTSDDYWQNALGLFIENIHPRIV